MISDFVARLAYDLTGPGGLILDLTCLRALRNIEDQVEAVEKALGSLFDPPRYVGQPLAVFMPNSFMKRARGQRLTLGVLPHWDLTHVIDTSGCYIPEHGMPTVLLVVRAQEPQRATVRCVLGLRGEPAKPDDPAQGLAWSSVAACARREADCCSGFSVCRDMARERFRVHPWAFGDREFLSELLDDCACDPGLCEKCLAIVAHMTRLERDA